MLVIELAGGNGIDPGQQASPDITDRADRDARLPCDLTERGIRIGLKSLTGDASSYRGVQRTGTPVAADAVMRGFCAGRPPPDVGYCSGRQSGGCGYRSIGLLRTEFQDASRSGVAIIP
ncbi:hypothetical protein CLV67_111219 [Actinoplanes italicus]|uniref:Uncharacterized protein n=1 Tax=Actinoplanes italicus TaxID=113567 RepID=A0A2T0K8B3_9ACTN|nr:hypothetical protein CLV67_111219 [Actinoplanes italicus]